MTAAAGLRERLTVRESADVAVTQITRHFARVEVVRGNTTVLDRAELRRLRKMLKRIEQHLEPRS